MEKQTNNSSIKAHYGLFFVLVMVILTSIPLVSAFDFDNVKSYDADKREVTITNALGFGDDIATVKLNTPLVYKVFDQGSGVYQKVAEFEVNNLGDGYSNALKDMEFYNVNNGMKKFDRTFKYKYQIVSGQREVNRYSKTCEEFNDNGIMRNRCPNEIVGTYLEDIYEWVDLEESKLNVLPKGTITIGVFVDVQEGDNVEWILTLFGKEINEWARWTSGLKDDLEMHTTFDGSGEAIDIGLTAHYNLSGAGPDRSKPGIQNLSFNFSSDGDKLVTSGGFKNLTNSATGSFSIWLKPVNSNAENGYAVQYGDGGTTNYIALKIDARGGGNDEITIELVDDSTVKWELSTNQSGIGDNTFNEWQHFVVTQDGTNVSFYLNGTKQDRVLTAADMGAWINDLDSQPDVIQLGQYSAQANNNYGGGMDELSVWVNRALTQSEVLSLYNNGVGLEFHDAGPTSMTVSLTKPANNTVTINQTVGFNVTYSPVNLNLTNTTLFVYDSGGSLFNQSTRSITGNDLNNSELDVTLSKGNYTWNTESCGINNSLLASCFISDGNFSLQVDNFFILSETFNNDTIEGSVETFKINITLASNIRVSTAFLNYNNTEYEGTLEASGTNALIIRNITIPSTTAKINNTFFWTINTDDGSQINSSLHNQTVSLLALDDCSAYVNQLFNFTLYDEDDQSLLDGPNQNTSIKLELEVIDTATNTQVLNYSNDFALTNPALVCVQNNLTTTEYRLDGVVEYKSLNRFQEFYHFQNFELNDQTQNTLFKLYNLNSSKGTEFKITYKDSNFVPVVGAIFNIQRKYIEEGLFKTVEFPKSGDEGYTIGHLVRNDVIYNIIISKGGVVLSTFTDFVADCQNPLLISCEINLNSFSSSNLPSDFRNLNDFSYTLTFDEDTRVVDSVYTIPSGVSSEISLNVTLFDSLGNNTVCSDSLTSSGGALSCTMPASFGNTTVVAKLYKAGEFQTQATIRLNSKPIEIYGANLLFIALFICLIFIGVSATSNNPMVYGILLALGSVIMVSLNLIYVPSWTGTGATLLWFIIAIGLMLIKGGTRQ
jgi:hypothetical protein|tara:strand:- start:1025 stop:4186 length:3162 start_codon:yes stop_codon:yes gene_type:complete